MRYLSWLLLRYYLEQFLKDHWVREIHLFPSLSDKDGSVQKIALVDCSCEGACPSFNENWLHQKIPILRPSALCLDENEQLALREMMQRNSLNRLTITGCNGYPLPIDIRSLIESNQTQLDGLNWLDEAKFSFTKLGESNLCSIIRQNIVSCLKFESFTIQQSVPFKGTEMSVIDMKGLRAGLVAIVARCSLCTF